MRHHELLLLSVVAAWTAPAIGSDCFAVQDADLRNACLAERQSDNFCFRTSTMVQRYCAHHLFNDIARARYSPSLNEEHLGSQRLQTQIGMPSCARAN